MSEQAGLTLRSHRATSDPTELSRLRRLRELDARDDSRLSSTDRKFQV